MAFLGELEGILYGEGLRDHSHLNGPISRVRDGGVGLENAGFGVSEVWVEAGAGFGLNKAFTYGSHPKSPYKLVVVKSLLSFN